MSGHYFNSRICVSLSPIQPFETRIVSEDSTLEVIGKSAGISSKDGL